MSAKNVIMSGLIIAGLAGGAYYYLEEQGGSKKPTTKQSKPAMPQVDWSQPDAIQQKIAADIKKDLKDLSPTSVEKILSNSKDRLELYRWMFVEMEKRSAESVTKRIEDLRKREAELERNIKNLTEGGRKLTDREEYRLKKQKKNLEAVKKELSYPHSMADALKDPKTKKLMNILGSRPAWLSKVLFTGECVRPGEMMAILTSIYEKHPAILKDKMLLDIATATAIEFAKSGWMHDRAVERADFYIRHWKAKDLNTVFDTLPFWERRMVCGCKGDNDFGSLASLEYAIENVNLPAEQYTGACWQAAYRLYNLYSESVHGSGYFDPYDDIYGDNRQQFTYEIGGVCGSLSHYGTFAALANGVPAMTSGEPGHCAFIVRIGDKWVPAYSLSWERGLHWQPWANMYVFSCLHMADELFSKKEQKKLMLSNAYRVLAGIYADNSAKARECLKKALKTQPLNMYAWREYSSHLSNTASEDVQAWVSMNEEVCNMMTKRYPEVAGALVAQSVYPGLKKALETKPIDEASATAKRVAMEFWTKVEEMGVDRWRIEDLLNAQRGIICEKKPDKVFDFFSDVLKTLVANERYAPVILSWGSGISDKMNEADRSKLMKAMIAGIGGGQMTDDNRKKLLTPIIQAAEKARDLTTIQALSKLLPAAYKKPGARQLPPHDAFPGKLMSRGGMIWTSSTCGHDDICAHWGLLEPEIGGQFHTASQKDAWVAVQLPRQTKVSGVVVIDTNGNDHRMTNMKLQYSETGKDDDWHDVADFQRKGRQYRADATEKRPTAKYVRVLRQGGPEFFHLFGIFVYGDPAA